MYLPLVSVLLLGMIPVTGSLSGGGIELGDLQIAPPSAIAQNAQTALSLREGVSASGILITDLASGQVVYGRDLDRRRSIASLTKLMTAIVVVERMKMDDVVTVPENVKDVEGEVVHLRAGAHYRVGDLLSAMLVNSANDAAVVLAEATSGSVGEFVKDMNARAKALGLHDTSFANPSGLDEDNHFSTPRDLAWLVSFALRNPNIAERMATKTETIQSLEGDSIALTHTHQLLHTASAVLLGKTGTTDAAGQCLLSVVKEGGRKYVVILLHSRERYADMRMLLNALAHLSV
ncbi:MAG: serine-type D-Ala-D-Ala carboxypeptidase [Candidatus Peribacteria bacterium]|nr:serine-type D-Ala-D-Ala carboxypeptidase [Candidatus Peribacteria bacterium]